MWQPSSYAPSPSPSQRPRSRGVTPDDNALTMRHNDDNTENDEWSSREDVLSLQLAMDDALTTVNAFWDTQMTAYNLKVEKTKSAMVARHTEERQELKHKLGGTPVKPRSSANLLALRKHQSTLSKAGEYAEAIRVKAKADALEITELKRAGAFHGGMMQVAQDKLACKQQDEIRALGERIRDGHAKLETQRRAELDAVSARYRAQTTRLQRKLTGGGGGGRGGGRAGVGASGGSRGSVRGGKSTGGKTKKPGGGSVSRMGTNASSSKGSSRGPARTVERGSGDGVHFFSSPAGRRQLSFA